MQISQCSLYKAAAYLLIQMVQRDDVKQNLRPHADVWFEYLHLLVGQT